MAAERLRTLINSYFFTECEFGNLTQSDATKISIDHRLQFGTLRKQADGKYPTASDLYLITEVAEIRALRQVIGFQAFVTHKAVDGAVVTTVGFRLHDGTSQRYWNGSAWVVNTSLWNTEDQVAANIGNFPTTAKKIGVVVNLKTTDGSVSPELNEIRVAYKARIPSFYEDILLRSLVPALKTGLRPTTEFIEKNFAGGTSINFGDVLTNSNRPFKIVDLEAIFNITDDPTQSTNLLQSYDTLTKIATLTGSVGAAKKLVISAIYQPDVILWSTSVDYSKVARVPAIHIVGTGTPQSSRSRVDGLSVTNKPEKILLVVPSPYRVNFRCAIIGLTPGTKDEARLAEAVLEFFVNNETLRSVATGELYRMNLVDEFEDITAGDEDNDLHGFQSNFEIMDVLVFTKAAYTIPMVGSMNLTGDMTGSATS